MDLVQLRYFLAAISTILGAILFLRFGYAVANAGLMVNNKNVGTISSWCAESFLVFSFFQLFLSLVYEKN